MRKFSLSGGRGFDVSLAAFAAASAGFVAFAMPNGLFTGLVEASRLPDYLAAAQPPLGQTARSAAVGAALLVTFGAVWALMAALGRSPKRNDAVIEVPEMPAPRLRRADAHPDAPPRPPLLARDLGEPLELDEPAPAEDAPWAESDDRPLPGFLVPQEAEEESLEAEAEMDSPEPEPEPIAELAARLPEAEAQGDESLSQLVNRIESGLSRKRQALPAADFPAVEEPAPAEPEQVGHRLRSAINDLQKIASTGG